MNKNITIFASGEGTNAQSIIDYFKNSSSVKIALIVSNKADANVLIRAKKENITTLLLNKFDFFENDSTIQQLNNYKIDLIVLAGFLWMIPESLIKAFPNKIINIHPALLPKYGGKGMYGDRVHQAIVDADEEESGISIHFVNEHFDEGEIIHQSRFRIEPGDDLEMIKFKGQQLEHLHYPKVVEQLLKKMRS